MALLYRWSNDHQMELLSQCSTRLSNTTTPVYLGIHLDRTLCYKTHIEKTKMKVNARNNIIRKLATSKWGCKASTLRPSCLALCYSAAEYACPVWPRSTHAPKMNQVSRSRSSPVPGIVAYGKWPITAGTAPHVTNHDDACRMQIYCHARSSRLLSRNEE